MSHSKQRPFQPHQKFIAYERYKRYGENIYVPRLLQVVDAKTLREVLHITLDEICWPRKPESRGYRLPLTFGDSNLCECEYAYPQLTFYCLPELRPSGFSSDTTNYYQEAIFLSNLPSYTCTALSRNTNDNRSILWKDNRASSSVTTCQLEDWDVYRSLTNSSKLYAIAIDEYNNTQNIVRSYTYSCTNPGDNPSGELPEIGKEWVFSKTDLEHMDPHDLFFFYSHNFSYLFKYLSDELQATLENYDGSREEHELRLLSVFEDEEYDEVCRLWNEDPTFKKHLIQCILPSYAQPYAYIPIESLTRYLKQLHTVAVRQKELLSEDAYRKYVDTSEIEVFLADCSQWYPKRCEIVSLLLDIYRALEIDHPSYLY